MLTPEQFAEVLCDDLELPPSSFAGPSAQSIRQQCEQFSTDMIPEDEEDRRVIVKVREEACRGEMLGDTLPSPLYLLSFFPLAFFLSLPPFLSSLPSLPLTPSFSPSLSAAQHPCGQHFSGRPV